jgi:hypothetical protein
MAGQYDKAKAALAPVAAAAEPPLIALFYLARAHAKLGDVDDADGLYLQIEAVGEREGAAWVSAARTARQHMNWMRDHGTWRLPAMPSEAKR